MSTRLVVDTDVGTDVDDLWTLAMVPGLDDVEVEAVTVVYGDTELRARLASLACSAMGLDVPVYRGCEETLSGKEVMWAGHEGDGVDGLLDADYTAGDAVDVLVERAAVEPGTLDVVAIGPLTNIAVAIARDPAFVTNLRRLTVMGGEFHSGWPEHNFSADARATEIVVTSGVPMTIMPLDQTLRVLLDRSDVDQIAAAHPIGPLLADQAHRFWAWLATVVPAATGDASPAHDPAALLALVEPSRFTFTTTAVESAGSHGFDGTVRGTPDGASPIDVVTDLDVEGVHAALLRAFGVRPRPDPAPPQNPDRGSWPAASRR